MSLKESNSDNDDSRVMVYSKPGCKYCKMAIELLQEKGIEFDVKTLDPDVNLSKYTLQVNSLKKSTGHKTFPFIFINNKFIGGYQELKTSVDDGSYIQQIYNYDFNIDF